MNNRFELLKIILLTEEKPSILLKNNQVTFKFLNELIGIPQNPVHHPEGDVWTHTLMVVDEAAKLKDKSNHSLAFMLSALMHDFGKISTTETLEDGKIVAYGHEKETHYIYEFFNDLEVSDNKLIEAVERLIVNHGRINGILFKATDKAFRKIYDTMEHELVNIDDLLLISEADHRGRGFSEDFLDYSKERIWAEGKIAQIRESIKSEKLVPLIQGKDLIQLGFKPSKEFKQILSESLLWQKDGLTREEILDKIKTTFHS